MLRRSAVSANPLRCHVGIRRTDSATALVTFGRVVVVSREASFLARTDQCATMPRQDGIGTVPQRFLRCSDPAVDHRSGNVPTWYHASHVLRLDHQNGPATTWFPRCPCTAVVDTDVPVHHMLNHSFTANTADKIDCTPIPCSRA